MIGDRMLVSFIIPAYNAADTIVRCLESIRNLTLEKEEYEIIVIDDASTDSTVSVIDGFKSQVSYPNGTIISNLTLLKQPENHRQGAARNRGVCVAKGEYICFVDADDAVTEGVVRAIRVAKEKQTDMTAFHHVFVTEKGDIIKEADMSGFEEGQLFSGIEMQNRHPYWCSGPVAYVYNRAFVERVNYPFVEDVLFEDSDFVMTHLYHAYQMAYSRDRAYEAYYNPDSTTHNITYKQLADYLLLGKRMFNLYGRIIDDIHNKSIIISADEAQHFANDILEGGCYNIYQACRRLIKLDSLREIKAFYQRVDQYADRKELLKSEHIRNYFWNGWTAICLRSRFLGISLSYAASIVFKMRHRKNG